MLSAPELVMLQTQLTMVVPTISANGSLAYMIKICR
jgi:hypothetical protein